LAHSLVWIIDLAGLTTAGVSHSNPMEFIVKYITSSTYLAHASRAMGLMLLAGHVQLGHAHSFMDSWLANQVVQAVPQNSFDADSWLEKQKVKSGHEFLAASQHTIHLEQSLLFDIEVALGKEQRRAMEGRIKAIENAMHPIFKALPKNEHGKLAHASVRYMLHRFFVEQHGWFIDGLFAEGDARNMSSPSQALKDRVPMFVQGLFEKRLVTGGFGVHEMAVMVAVVEDSVHREAQEQLLKTLEVLDIPRSKNFSANETQTIIESYMSGFVLNTNMSSISGDKLRRQTRAMPRYYPTWSRARPFFQDVQNKQMVGSRTAGFAVISNIVREIVDTFGKFHGKQCQGLKAQLQELERKGSSGCVRLPDFYEKGLKADSNWLMVESPEYLRHIGVLDETNIRNPRLLSANYINSPTNCLQPTGYYLVCCHNECDDILGMLEKRLAKPTATPDEILAAFADFGMNTGWNRGGNIAPAIRFRLEEVAEFNAGRVPIHGRLFAQWLHHVFPRECPYPHLSGARNPQWITDFEEETGKEVQLSDEAMQVLVRNASESPSVQVNVTKSKLDANFGSCAPWSQAEELFAPIPTALPLHELESDPHVWALQGGIACLGALSAFTVMLLRTFKSLRKLRPSSKGLFI